MAESIYKVIEVVGTSTESWEKAAAVAVNRAAENLRELWGSEGTAQDLVIDNNKVTAYRTKISLSFKYEDE